MKILCYQFLKCLLLKIRIWCDNNNNMMTFMWIETSIHSFSVKGHPKRCCARNIWSCALPMRISWQSIAQGFNINTAKRIPFLFIFHSATNDLVSFPFISIRFRSWKGKNFLWWKLHSELKKWWWQDIIIYTMWRLLSINK